MRGYVRRRGTKWCVVLDAGRDVETGKRRQKWISGFNTKEAAEDALVELLGKRLRGDTIDPDLTRSSTISIVGSTVARVVWPRCQWRSIEASSVITCVTLRSAGCRSAKFVVLMYVRTPRSSSRRASRQRLVTQSVRCSLAASQMRSTTI